MSSKLEEMVPVTVDFPARHIGPRKHDARAMLKQLGFSSLDDLTNTAVPDDIKLNRDLILDEPLSEYELIKRIKSIADKNNVSGTEYLMLRVIKLLDYCIISSGGRTLAWVITAPVSPTLS